MILLWDIIGKILSIFIYGAAIMAWEGYTYFGSDGVSPPLGSVLGLVPLNPIV